MDSLVYWRIRWPRNETVKEAIGFKVNSPNLDRGLRRGFGDWDWVNDVVWRSVFAEEDAISTDDDAWNGIDASSRMRGNTLVCLSRMSDRACSFIDPMPILTLSLSPFEQARQMDSTHPEPHYPQDSKHSYSLAQSSPFPQTDVPIRVRSRTR